MRKPTTNNHKTQVQARYTDTGANDFASHRYTGIAKSEADQSRATVTAPCPPTWAHLSTKNKSGRKKRQNSRRDKSAGAGAAKQIQSNDQKARARETSLKCQRETASEWERGREREREPQRLRRIGWGARRNCRTSCSPKHLFTMHDWGSDAGCSVSGSATESATTKRVGYWLGGG